MRIGIVGLGRWGSKSLGEWMLLRQQGKVREVRACDTDPKALKVAKAMGVDGAHENVSTMLASVDAVHIAAPNPLHYPIAMEAIKLGLHVLIEKPMALRGSEARELVAEAISSHVAVVPGHVYRHDDSIKLAKKLIPQFGGKPLHARMRWTSHITDPSMDGVVWDLLPHPVDILNDLWGEWPDDWMGLHGRLKNDDSSVHDTSWLAALYPSGRSAWIDLGWRDYRRQRGFEIVCEQATIAVDLIQQSVRVYEPTRSWERAAPNNTIRSELLSFLSACNDPASSRGMAEAGAGCVETVQEAHTQSIARTVKP